MNILMINPKFPETYWGFQHTLRIIGKKAIFPPLGLLAVAALLPKNWQKRVLDLNAGKKLKAADIEWADMVFITAMLIQKNELHRLVKLCKSHGKRVVVGGPYVSTSMEKIPDADHIFIKAAELTIPQFVKDLEQGTTKRFYHSDYPDMELSPVPEFGLVNLHDYNSAMIQFSAGCPYKCDFCDIPGISGPVQRPKTNAQMERELDALFKLGRRGSVFIVDDNFIGNLKNVRHLLPALTVWQKDHGYPFSFYTQASVNLEAHRDVLDGMRAAGFNKVFLGIESPVEETLAAMQKTQNTKRSLMASVERIQRSGLEVMAGFFVGNDTDPPDIADRQIDFIRSSAIPLAMVGTLTALPDTPLWSRLKAEGRLLSEADGDNTGQGQLNFIPECMEASKIVEGHRRILRTVYASREFYDRVLESLRRLPPPVRKESSELSVVQKLAILGRTILFVGIIERERLEFWRYLGTTVRNHRERFAYAVRLAIAGYHQRVLTRKLARE